MKAGKARFQAGFLVACPASERTTASLSCRNSTVKATLGAYYCGDAYVQFVGNIVYILEYTD
jgi:hypothetical protein